MNNRNNTRKSKSGAAVFVLLFVFAPLLIGFITGKGFAVALFSMAAVFAAAGWLFGSKMTQNEDNKAKRCTMQVNAVVVDNKVEVVQSHTWDSMRQAYDDSTYNSYTPIYEYTDQYGTVHRRAYYTSHGQLPIGMTVTIFIDPNDPDMMLIPEKHSAVQKNRRGLGVILYGIAASFALFGVILLISGH